MAENSETEMGSSSFMSYARITALVSETASESGAYPTLEAPLPKLSATGLPVPSINVPRMDNNPFVSTSQLPEGSAFIAVGSFLGLISLAFIAWRVAARIALSRQLKKDATAGFMTETRREGRGLLLPVGPNDFSGPVTGVSAASKLPLPSVKQKSAASNPADILGGILDHTPGDPLGAPSQRNALFYSPTAQVMNSAAGVGLGVGVSPLGSLSNTNVRSTSHFGSLARQQGRRQSAAGSVSSVPGFRHYHAPSSVSQMSRQRPPSAYLDDILDLSRRT